MMMVVVVVVGIRDQSDDRVKLGNSKASYSIPFFFSVDVYEGV